jgi:hypothetical protein
MKHRRHRLSRPLRRMSAARPVVLRVAGDSSRFAPNSNVRSAIGSARPAVKAGVARTTVRARDLVALLEHQRVHVVRPLFRS